MVCPLSVVSGPLRLVISPLATDDGLRTTNWYLANYFRENVGLAEDFVFFAVDFDFGAAVLAVDHFVADFHGELAAAAGIEQLTGARRETLPRCGFSLSGIRQHDSAGGHLFSFERFDNDAIIERTQV